MYQAENSNQIIVIFDRDLYNYSDKICKYSIVSISGYESHIDYNYTITSS